MVCDAHIILTDDEYQSLAPSLIESVEDDSVFFEENEKKNIPQLHWSDMKLGNVLGAGGFCTVQELLSIKNINDTKLKNSCDETVEESCHSDESSTPSQESLMRFQCQKNEVSPFAVKRIKDSIKGKMFTRAFIDLSSEIKFLSRLSHTNIIEVRGISTSHNTSDRSRKDDRLFVILDRLYITLDEQLRFWKKMKKRQKGLCQLGICGANSIEINKLKVERVTAAVDLSSALNYLHRHKIIYRDVKPQNVGFDRNGVLKLFDFGLAKELRKKDLVADFADEKLYKLTQFVGSLPYMSPEIFFGQHYNLRADVYSFGLLLYEIIYLKPLSKRKHIFGEREDFYLGMRPELTMKEDVSTALANLIAKCWCETAIQRPDMKCVHSTLKNELEQLLSKM